MVERPPLTDRPPTRRDRNVAAIIDSLPWGSHLIQVEPNTQPDANMDGSFSFISLDSRKRIVITPHGAEMRKDTDNGTEGSRAEVESKGN